MDIRCPSCKTLYEFDEARLKGSSVNLKCSQCGHIFRVEAPKGKQRAPQKRWMVRKDSGDILYFTDMTQLQKWIIDCKVSRDDTISKTGKTWKSLGSIRELASLFEVADNIQSLNLKSSPDLVGSPDPSPEYFDPHAPGRPAQSPSRDGSDGPWNANDAKRPTSGRWNISMEPPKDDSEPSIIAAASEPKGNIDISKEKEKTGPIAPEGLKSIGNLDQPLTVGDQEDNSSLVPILLSLLLFFLLIGGVYIFNSKPAWLTGAAVQPGADAQARVEAPDAAVAAAPDTSISVAAPDVAAVAKVPPDAEQVAVADTSAPSTQDAGKEAVAADVSVSTDTVVAAKAVPDVAVVASKGNPTAKKVPPKGGAMAKKTTPNNKPDPPKRVVRGSYDSLMKQGYELRRSGQPGAAIEAFQAAVAQRPSSAEAQAALGWCFLRAGSPARAVIAFNRTLQANPRFIDAYIGLGNAYRATGQSQQALGAYRKYLQVAPSGPKAGQARKMIEKLTGN